MNATEIIRRLHQHRVWANRQLLTAARQLSTGQLHQEFAIGQGSVWKTLTHLLAAEFVWLAALMGDDDPLLPGDVRGKLPGNQLGESTLGSLDELQTQWRDLEKRWSEYLAQLDEATLDELVYKISTSSGAGQRFGTRRVDVLIHVCTHAQYTTAQLVNMLRQLGQSELPDVMLISLARRET